jgi:hypothetical protein
MGAEWIGEPVGHQKIRYIEDLTAVEESCAGCGSGSIELRLGMLRCAHCGRGRHGTIETIRWRPSSGEQIECNAVDVTRFQPQSSYWVEGKRPGPFPKRPGPFPANRNDRIQK